MKQKVFSGFEGIATTLLFARNEIRKT